MRVNKLKLTMLKSVWYSIIYKVIEEMEEATKGDALTQNFKESIGEAAIRETFKVS